MVPTKPPKPTATPLPSATPKPTDIPRPTATPLADQSINPPTNAHLIVSGFVWNDEDKDGLQDEHEVGLAGIVLMLYGTDPAMVGSVAADGAQIKSIEIGGNPEENFSGQDVGSVDLHATVNVTVNRTENVTVPLTSTVTDHRGYYQFSRLTAGNYYLSVVPPPSYLVSPANIGLDDSIDSDVEPTEGFSALLSLEEAQPLDNIDVGLHKAFATRNTQEEAQQIFLPIINR